MSRHRDLDGAVGGSLADAIRPGFGAARSDADECELQRRDTDLDLLVSGLTRRLKRVLREEHNALLDGLRQARWAPSPEAALLSKQAQLDGYAGAVLPYAEQAVAAGARFVTRSTPGPAGGGGARDAAGGAEGRAGHRAAGVAERVARDAAGAIVEPLRLRIGAVLGDRGRDTPEVLVDALAAVYREARTHRVEPVAADALSAAHAEAAWRAAPDGSALRWIAEDAEGPCPDCDDNVLAGPIAKGDAFPTGQLHPPAHQGCRCLLVLGGA